MKNALMITRFSRGFHNYSDGIGVELKEIFQPYLLIAAEREDAAGITLSELRQYDAVLLSNPAVWTMAGDSDFIIALIVYLVNGGNVCILHANGLGQSKEGAAVFGGRFNIHPPYQNYHLIPAPDAEPAMTSGISDFYLCDEMHMNEVDPLLNRETLLLCGRPEAGSGQPDSVKVPAYKRYEDIYGGGTDWIIPVAWRWRYGLGKAVHVCPGHNAQSYRAPQLRELLKRCAEWLAEPAG